MRNDFESSPKRATNIKKRALRSQSGQAVVEYLLVLVVVVGLILGGLYQLNSAFRVWANSYFGEYLMCLMESGELPGLGQPNPESECRQLYRSFSLAEGEPLVGEGVNEDGSRRGGDGDGSNGGSAAAAPSGNAENSFVSRSRSAGNRSGTASRFRSRAGAGEDDEDGISRESSSGGGTVTDGFSNDEGGATRFAVRGESRRGGRGRKLDEKEEAEKRTKAKNVEQEAEQTSGPKLIKISRAPTESTEAPEIEEMGIGGFLRYLIIAAIIIAVVIFLGGQVLQVSKSME